jgi:hypothetical protein
MTDAELRGLAEDLVAAQNAEARSAGEEIWSAWDGSVSDVASGTQPVTAGEGV